MAGGEAVSPRNRRLREGKMPAEQWRRQREAQGQGGRCRRRGGPVTPPPCHPRCHPPCHPVLGVLAARPGCHRSATGSRSHVLAVTPGTGWGECGGDTGTLRGLPLCSGERRIPGSRVRMGRVGITARPGGAAPVRPV